MTREHPFGAPGAATAVSGSADLVRAESRSYVAAISTAGTALLLLLAASAQGGYFPSSWSWTALALAWAIGLWAVVGPGYELERLDVAMLGALSAFLLWVLASTVWSADMAQSLLEAQRALVYVTGLAAFLLLGRRRTVPALACAVTAAISLEALYALATRLFPDRIGGYDPVAVYRLSGSIGYWNGLGIFCVLGILLALGLALQARPAIRIVAAVSLVVLLPTLYFTFSRGSWIALGVGAAAMIAGGRNRLRLVTGVLLVLPAPALAVLLSSRADGLTHEGVPRAEAAESGHRLALVLLGLVALQIALALAFVLVERRVRPGARLKRAYGAALLATLAVAASFVFVRFGSPPELASKGYSAFTAPPPSIDGDLNDRLLNFSGNGRADLWSAAWAGYREHELVGSGAGSYERHWLRTRETPLKVRDAHGLYVETFAELGPLGLGLLAVALAVPLVAFWRSARAPVVAAALGAYAAFLAHTAVDWDWELSAVTLAGLLCGALLVLAARRGAVREPRAQVRGAMLLAALAAAAAAFVGLLGNSALASAEDAVVERRWESAGLAAVRAERWMPWSSRPWVVLGEARLGAGDTVGAAASFEKAVAVDDGDWRAWSQLAVVTTGRTKSRAIRRATELNPLEPSVRSLRAAPAGG